MKPRPIRTAPRDGTWVFVGGGDGIDELMWEGKRPRWVAAKYLPKYGEWAFDYWDGDFRSIYRNPTHWLPIPNSP